MIELCCESDKKVSREGWTPHEKKDVPSTQAASVLGEQKCALYGGLAMVW